MDPLPSQHINGTGTQQPSVSFLGTVHGSPSGNPGWRSNAWGPVTLRPPAFATGGNGIFIRQQAPLHHGRTDLIAEPEGRTTLPQPHSTSSSYTNRALGEETAGLPPGYVTPKEDGVSFSGAIPPIVERVPWVPPKSGRGIICDQCPDLPSFNGKNALRKHRRQVHAPTVPRCPICSARVPKRPLATHLKKVHGVADASVGAGPLVVSTPLHINSAAEPFHRPQGGDDATISHTNETTSVRVYCQEYDCGKGFSSKEYLESHRRFFHPKRWEQIVGVQEASSSKDMVKRSAERPLGLTSIPSHVVGGRLMQDSCGPRSPVGIHLPGFGGGPQDPDLVENARKRISTEPSPSIQGGAIAQPEIASSTTGTLSLCCRMCGAPPKVTTQPTVTTCGHLFCSECITQHVVSTSRCPVCNSSILLYCLFKLDLPVTS